jgi:hypothetical protein
MCQLAKLYLIMLKHVKSIFASTLSFEALMPLAAALAHEIRHNWQDFTPDMLPEWAHLSDTEQARY